MDKTASNDLIYFYKTTALNLDLILHQSLPLDWHVKPCLWFKIYTRKVWAIWVDFVVNLPAKEISRNTTNLFKNKPSRFIY